MAERTVKRKGHRDVPPEAPPPPARRWRVRRSHGWALLFTAVIAAWMLSGELIVGGQPTGAAPTTPFAATDGARPEPLVRVRVASFVAEPRQATLRVRGRTEAEARVEVRSETAGVVERVAVAKGARVAEGAELCRLEAGARRAGVAEARALLAQAQADHDASQQLAARGHGAKLKVAADQARLDAARAALERAELELERTRLLAPFAGIVEDLPAKPGGYLAVGGACASVVALDPLTATGYVSEREVGRLRVGLEATVVLVTGETVAGALTYIAPAAEPRTRTFRVDVQLANPDGALRDGVTAEIAIPLAAERAHRIPPSILTLDDAGRIGVRSVEDGDTARFLPVRVLSDAEDGVWVAGLPETVRLITVGQEYVADGQQVEAVAVAGAATP